MLSRRTFFRGTSLGLGGVYLGSCIRELEATTPSKGQPRVIFFVQGNGLYPDEIQPIGLKRPKNPTGWEEARLDEYKLPFSMEPLAPWTKQMTLVNGLSGRIARGSHNMGFAALGCWPMGKKDYGETVDAAIARKLGGIYQHVGLGVSNRASSLTYNLTSAGRGKALPTILNPLVALKQYFAAGASGSARRDFDVDTNLLDFMADDVKRMAARLRGSEKEKLEKYLSAFESISGRQSKLAAMAKEIEAATPEIDAGLGNIVQTKTAPTRVFDRLEAQFDIAAGTLIAGLTNVVTISAGAGPDRIGLDCMASEVGEGNGYIGSHGIGHGGSAAGMTAARCHALIRRKCLEKLAKFLKTLESIPEGNGSMLDNTLVVYLSDSAEGHHPVCKEWPFVLIGNLGGRLNLGNRYLRSPWYGESGHRTIANLYLSLLHAVGEKQDTFGIADSAIKDLNQSGPLTEILA